VPYLTEDVATFGVYSIGHALPAGELLLRKKARHSGITARISGDISSLSELKSSFAGSLSVILHHEVGWYVDAFFILAAPHTSQRSLHKLVFECDVA
jgi:hypothetical protein